MKESDEDPWFYSPDGHDSDKYNPDALLTDDGQPVYHQNGVQWFVDEPPPRGWSQVKEDPDPKRGAPTVQDVDDAVDNVGTDADAIKKWLGAHHFDTTGNIPQSDFSPGVNDNDVQAPVTNIGRFDTWTGVKGPVSVVAEWPESQTFQSAFDALQDANDPIDGGAFRNWLNIAQQIQNHTDEFRSRFSEVAGWDGKTADAVKANVAAFTDPTNGPAPVLARGIEGLSIALATFDDILSATINYIVPNGPVYNDDLNRWPHHRDEIVNEFNSFAQKVLAKVYVPSIQGLAAKNPAFTSGAGPNINPNTDAPPPPPAPNNADVKDPNLNDPNLNDPNSGDAKFAGANLPGINTPNLAPPGLNGLNAEPPPNIKTPDITSLTGGDIPGLPNESGGVDLADPNLMPPPDFGSSLPNTDLGGDPFTSGGGLSGPGGDPFTSGGGLSGPGGDPFTSGGGLSGPGGDPFTSGGGLSGLSNALGSAAGAAGGPAGAAKSLLGNPSNGGAGAGAIGPAADAAEQALGAATKGTGGAPGFGPKGLNALSGPDGAHAGGGGAGVGARGLDLSRPAGAPVAGVSKGLDLSGPARAGMTNAPGSSAGGGGQPSGGGGGAGQRGPGGKEHKANKALRNKKNGELVLGDVDAVLPVLGDDQPDRRAAGDDSRQQAARQQVGAGRSTGPQQDPRFASRAEPDQTVTGS